MFRNKEFRSVIIKLIILQIMLGTLGLFVVTIFINQTNKNIIERDMALVGNIVKDYPELKDVVVPYITKEIPKEDIMIGQEILKSYGYNIKMDQELQPVLKDIAFNMKAIIVFIIFSFIIPLAYIIKNEYKEIYGKMKKVYQASERVVEGDFSIYLNEEGEGDFSILNHQFNQMANRLENNLDLLKKEKVFLRNMVSDISHQLKTPLSSLMVINEILLEDQEMESTVRLDFLKREKSQLERIEWLTINLLKVARIEVGSIEFKREKVLLTEMIDIVQVVLGNKLEHCQLKLVGNTKASFYGDKNWTSEALINIVKNSLEHGASEIEVILEETPLFSNITVKDNGEGIEKEHLPHVFKRFYKAKSQVKAESIGIGLNLTKLIVESQNGTIAVKSKKGQGTQMTITFLKGII